MDELRRKKLELLFKLLDRDGDGALEQADYGAVGHQVATMNSLTAGSEAYAAMEQRMAAYWAALQQDADSNDDQRITRSEWLHGMEQQGAALQEARVQMVAVAAALLDRDGDGYITPEDYGLLFQRLGHDFAQAGDVFRRLDRNGNGRIDRAELGQLVEEFFTSSDPEAPGSWLLGPL